MQYEEKHFLVLVNRNDGLEEEEYDNSKDAYDRLDMAYKSRGYKRGHYERRMTVCLASFSRSGV